MAKMTTTTTTTTTKNKKKKKKKKQPKDTRHNDSAHDNSGDDKEFKGNFVSEAGPGCYIARIDDPDCVILEWEQGLHREDFDGHVPDIALDPDCKTVTVCNLDNVTKVSIVTVFEHSCIAKDGITLPTGRNINEDGQEQVCTTFIVLCPPNTFAYLCQVDCDDITNVQIDNDTQPWKQHPSPNDGCPTPLAFPLSSPSSSSSSSLSNNNGGNGDTDKSYLCTQGEGGILTHFFSGNLHAIDFQCPIGTPLVAAGNGTIVEVRTDHTLSGIAVSNLFKWNSIMLQLDKHNDDDGNDDDNGHGVVVVEYVHIQSATVQRGDRVKEGDIIGYSGSVGFSPEPHLHFAAYRSTAPDAPTVRVQFHSKATGSLFSPEAGKRYNQDGLDAPAD